MTEKKYKALPIVCDAFRLEFNDDKPHRWLRNLPSWFQKLYDTGDVMYTNSQKYGRYITINKQGGHVRANEGSWIIRASDQNIFVMTGEEFSKHFALHEK